MKCSEIERHIQTYLALRKERVTGVEPPLDVEAFESHMRTCSTCRARFLQWERLEAALDGLPRVDPPEELTHSIISCIRAGRGHQGGLLLPRPCAALAGMGVELAFLGAALGMFLLFMWSALDIGMPALHTAPVDLVRSDAARVTAAIFSKGQAIGEFGTFLPRLFAQGAGLMASILQFGGMGFGG